MKKFTLLSVIFLTVILNTKAQNYLIDFAGSGDTTNIQTIQVYDLTSGDSAALNGGDILKLKVMAGIENTNNDAYPVEINPNPLLDRSVLSFFAPVEGDVVIDISEISGKNISQAKLYLPLGRNEFSISGIERGLYVIKVSGRNYHYSAKLISQNDRLNVARIEYLSNGSPASAPKPSAPGSTFSTVEMNYTTGDVLLYKSKSGRYSTYYTDVPTGSKTITFQFTGCTDANGHNYPTLQLGGQTWMAQNLNVGMKIIDTTSAKNNGIIEKYCYEQKESNCDIYGGLYQWGEMMNYDTTAGIQGICPAGWHIPTDAEWTTLTTSLGGDSTCAGKLKETGTAHWAPPNTGATNESGFTALPGGYRYYSGTLFITDYATFWTSNETSATDAWYRLVQFNYVYVTRRSYTKENGYSVRCLKD